MQYSTHTSVPDNTSINGFISILAFPDLTTPLAKAIFAANCTVELAIK
ncbi:hypothetical protein [Clostridium sp.]|nr:hypothetical protein [Clostridium sp.]MBK5234913.1 hypothetical protein [Clostridium sp.]